MNRTAVEKGEDRCNKGMFKTMEVRRSLKQHGKEEAIERKPTMKQMSYVRERIKKMSASVTQKAGLLDVTCVLHVC